MTAVETYEAKSLFDAIRQVDENGREYWTARDLMAQVEYADWRNFERAIERAMMAAANSGYQVDDHFVQFKSDVVGSTNVLGLTRSYTQRDYKLSRFASYLVYLNGDPTKPMVAAGQAYFVRKTREAEIVQHEIPKTYAAALRAAADSEERATLAEAMQHEAEAKVVELRPRALGAEAAECLNNGQRLYDLRDAIKQRLGLASVNDAMKAARQVGVYYNLYGSNMIGRAWLDVVFASPTQSSGVEDGTVRVRPGRQDEVIERMAKAWARLLSE